MLNNNVVITINDTKIDENGNYMKGLEGTWPTLTNIFGPNSDDPNFYKNLFDNTCNFEKLFIPYCGWLEIYS